MIKMLLCLLLAVCVNAAPRVTDNDTTLIWSFRADSLKYGNVTELTGGAYQSMCVMADDTAHDGFSGDSIKFNFGYRIGVEVPNSNVRTDTIWGAMVRVGTMSTMPADTAGKWIDSTLFFNTDSSTGEPAVMIGLIDTLSVTGYAGLINRFTQVQQGHFIQPWVKGLTGNREDDGGFVKVRLQMIQPKYIPMRQQ